MQNECKKSTLFAFKGFEVNLIYGLEGEHSG